MSLLDAKDAKSRHGGPSFSLKHRLLRFVWGIIWNGLGIWTPVVFHGWRRLLLQCFGANIDKTARVYPGVQVWYPSNLSMGYLSCLAQNVNCYCMDRIEIGKYAVISQGAYLCGGTHDIDDPHFQLVTKPIYIGDYAWIAANAFVGPGVRVGKGAVLGAGAVTFKNLQDWAVYIGNPAAYIRQRREVN